MSYGYMAVAILSEVIATSFLRFVEGFSRPLPLAIVVVGYGLSFYFLSLTLKSLPTGIVYATLSGVGIMLISTIAWIFQGQKLDWPAILGMALIIAGALVLNLLSKASVH